MNVAFADLDGADLAPLRDLAAAWGTVHLKTVETRQSFDDVVSRLDPADGWLGESQAASRIRGDELFDQVLAGITEAFTIKGILDDAVTRFEAAQQDLHAVVATLAGMPELDVDSGGTVTVNRAAAIASSGGSEDEAVDLWDAHRAEYQTQIDTAVSDADTADAEISRALAFAGETEYGEDVTFNAHALDVDEFVRMSADAERATELLRTDPAELSETELAELNDLLAENGEHPYFAATFVGGMEPAEFIDRYGELALYTWGQGDEDIDAIMAEFQHNLGSTLATATNPEYSPHLDEAWRDDFMEAGMRTQQMDSDTTGFFTGSLAVGPYGYEVIAPLLRHGEYHEDFIVPVTEHLMRADAAMEPPMWMDLRELGLPNPFDPRDSGNGHPLNDAMVALDNNPVAAATFFGGDEEGAYPDAYYGWGAGELPPVEGGRVDWMLDRVQDTEGADIGVGHLGNALEAASTGVSSGDTGSIPPPPSEDNARVASAVLNYVGDVDHRDAITGTEAPLSGLNDNLADIHVNYMSDIHGILGDQDVDGELNSWAIPPHHNTLDVDPAVLQRTLEALGSDPDAALRIATGSETNGNVQLGLAMHQAPEGSTDTYASAVESHATVMGHLNAGELHEIVADYEAAHEDGGGIPYADIVQTTSTNAAGVAAGLTTANPWAAAAGSQGAGYVIDWAIDPFRAEPEPDPGPGEDVRDASEPARQDFRYRIEVLATAILAEQGHELTDVHPDGSTYADRVNAIARELETEYETARNRAADTRQEGG